MPRDNQLSMFDETPEPSEKPINPDAPDSPAGKRVFVVDAYGLVYQVFHALPEMQGRQGESVNAVFGFMRDIFFLLEHLSPDFLFAAFDLHHPTFRHEEYKEYKIQRESMPEDLQSQIPRIRQLLEVMRIPILAEAGFEADDILATVAAKTESAGGECFLVTSDKDCRQLLTEHVKIYSLRRGKVLDREFLMTDWGITPEQVIDYQSLVGDSSDNIPGIAKIGPKTARDLIQRFGSVEEILKPENLDAFFGVKSSARKQNLMDGAEILRMSRRLVTLRRDVPITVDWQAGHVSRFDFLAAKGIFQEYAFHSLGGKLAKLDDLYRGHSGMAAGNEVKRSATRVTGSEPPSDSPPLSGHSRCASFPAAMIPTFPGRFSPEFASKNSTKTRFLLPADFETPNAAALTKNLEALREEIENPEIVKVGFDLKKVWKTLHAHGISLSGPVFDVMIAAYMLFPGEKEITLRELAEQFPEAVPADFHPETLETHEENDVDGEESQTGLFDFPDEEETPKKSKKSAKKQEPPHHSTYAKYQQAFLETIYPLLAQKLTEEKLDTVCYAVEFPLIPVLAEMETAGIYVDKARLEKLHKRFAAKESSLREELLHLANPDANSPPSEGCPKGGVVIPLPRRGGGAADGVVGADYNTGHNSDSDHPALTGTPPEEGNHHPVGCAATPPREGNFAPETLNLNSPQQLQKILFEKLKLPIIRKTKTGISTDAQTLEELAALNINPFPAKLLEYRSITKLINTYVDALPDLIDKKTGRIHTTFNQAVTATGRLSSSEPNLQNIPVRTEEGREIRAAFMPHPEGWRFLSADYSQIELRVLAHYCRDATLCEAFHQDKDVHTEVAAQIYSVPPEEVTSAMRRVAKSVNFGVIYGQSAFGLSKQIGIPQDEAQHFITTYFAKYPLIQSFLDTVLDDAIKTGHVSTILGRHRRITGIRPQRKGQLNLAERMAVNAVIQGSAADIIKLAMLAVHERLVCEKRESRLLLQIHDELLLEVPHAESSPVKKMVEEEMSGVWKLDVPLKVHAVLEKDWGEKD